MFRKIEDVISPTVEAADQPHTIEAWTGSSPNDHDDMERAFNRFHMVRESNSTVARVRREKAAFGKRIAFDV